MIKGQVNPQLESIIPVTILNGDERQHSIQAILDTGFSGHLTLPSGLIDELDLIFIESRRYFLANNAPVNFDLFQAVLDWDNQVRTIHVLSSESNPLVGMKMVQGSHIFINAVDGGEVRILTQIP